ncbi:peptide chain release factor N(5)-glutamine methyltransferase [Anaerorudis cellulosivorans]|uniref:peptide chain release factor N(5)-glutamine methyltransferase n=1 Tax=Anaerorudis cellulosivorans TaxID=3397862 RepID=UPI00221F0FA2|nr:peptide chain release factor N(5)-glutamine methyltransferase [Seramator thermalis]MCW1734695.1 peptide chain release factor N(5)-glutamine methyltransferase [Seramator thermalis]
MTYLILKEVCDLPFYEIVCRKFNDLSDVQDKKIQDIVERLKKYEPLQYILGKTAFFGMEFNTNPFVLIPRPETEELIEWVLSENDVPNPRILDLCTGSGCIAIVLAKKIPGAELHALDISSAALDVAKLNARKNGVEIIFRCVDVLKENCDDTIFDIMVSNPPYVTEKEKQEMKPNVLQYEPPEALFVPNDNPLIFYDRISDMALRQLNKGGKLYFEINCNYGKQMVSLLEKKGFSHVELRKDISKNDRMIRAIK